MIMVFSCGGECMVNWQVTATTIYCDAVDDEATIMVYRDGSANCTGHQKYSQPSPEIAKLLKKKGKQLQRKLECPGLGCPRITQYKNKLFNEEKEACPK